MQGNKLELSDLAIEQINDIYDFHEKTRKGKGGDFLEKLWDCIEKIQASPRKWQYLGTEEEAIRRAITGNPQTIILYAIEEESIEFMTVGRIGE